MKFEDIDVTSEGAPEAPRGWGSPTILVEGRDVAGAPRPAGASCRLYRHTNDETRGAPSAAMIQAALDRARTEDSR
jgi:mercuric ion transport protein